MRVLLFAIACLANVSALADPAPLFTRPDGLRPAITFWTLIYGELDSATGVVHDSRDLSRVYQIIYLNRDASNGDQDRSIDAALAEWVEALNTLASGEHDDLGTIERQALAIWGEDADAETLAAASERVRFQRGQADRLADGLKRARRWRTGMQGIFAREGLPLELLTIPHVESSYRTHVRSKAGALGLWQLMPATARRYMRVDATIDERLDPYKSAQAAAQLLRQNYSVLKSWPLAITAYNHGLGGVRRAVRETGSSDIAEIVARYDGDRFGFASRNFYAAFLAALDVSRSPRRATPLAAAITVETESFLPLAAVIEAFDVDALEMWRLNPSLHHDVFNDHLFIPSGYPLRLPPDFDPQAAAQTVARLSAEYGFSAQRPRSRYEVLTGDSLSEIAERHNIDTERLAAINGVTDQHRIRAGQELRVPLGAEPEPLGEGAVAYLATQQTGERRADFAVTPLERVVEVDAGRRVLLADPVDYSVAADATIEIQIDETLGHYADWLGFHSEHLRRLNGLSEDAQLIVGDRLRLDFSKVSRERFEDQRIAFQQARQLRYFERYHISGVYEHRIANGDNLWLLANQYYDIPLWLLRQYNPDIDVDTILPLESVIYVPLVHSLPTTAQG